MTAYTSPELSAERHICGPLKAKILRDPCAHCLHRELLWGKASCKDHTGRTWWKCRDGKTQPTFEIDHSTTGGNP